MQHNISQILEPFSIVLSFLNGRDSLVRWRGIEWMGRLESGLEEVEERTYDEEEEKKE